MKILITIPHYYNASNDGHGSGGKNLLPRAQALSSCLFNLYSLLSPSQCMIDIFNKKTVDVNRNFIHNIDIVVCTTGDKHLLNQINLPKNFYAHHNTTLENPKFLGFECQNILKANL